jgi:RHS repeat-associated protein
MQLVLKNITYSYPFGSLKPLRHSGSNNYRFGFNGMEVDGEVKGDNNSLDFGARIYDPRIGRWLSLDPLMKKYPSMSPYNGFANNPILFIDSDGREVDVSTLTDPKHQAALQNLVSTEIGRNFIAQFARKGDVIGGVKFNSTGNRVNDILSLNSSSVNMSGRNGLTRTFFKKGENGFGKRLRYANQGDVGKGFIHLIDLKIGLSEEQSTLTIGHESLIHVNEDAKRLNAIDKKGESGGYNNFKEAAGDLINIDSSAEEDHNKLGEGKAIEFKKFGKQLDKVKKTKEYSEGVKSQEKQHE